MQVKPHLQAILKKKQFAGTYRQQLLFENPPSHVPCSATAMVSKQDKGAATSNAISSLKAQS